MTYLDIYAFVITAYLDNDVTLPVRSTYNAIHLDVSGYLPKTKQNNVRLSL